MPIIYNVTIKPTEKENCFRITWHNVETDTVNSFEKTADITQEETQMMWRWSRCQLDIGQKLFRFLDGDAQHLNKALEQANLQGEKLQIDLRTCKQTADWPFELLADNGTFLLPRLLHLVRCVTDRGSGKKMTPQNRQLKMLFMACSALDVKPELDFEKEEEAIFRITENLAIDMEVEDSGSLEGLRSRLEREQYDVVYLSGHAGIDKGRGPYFIMEDEFGNMRQVSPGELWNKALIENPPRLLFLSGCRTGETPDSDESTDAVSYAHLLVESYNVPTVLGWGRLVHDEQAIHAGKMLFHELSRGKTILEAVQRVRFELITDFSSTDKPAWPLLRLFSSGMPLNSIVVKEQEWKPKVRIMNHVYLKNSQVKVLAEGFVGRRRQMQTGLRALKQDRNKVGLLILGTGGLGKSCLAGKICERFPGYTLVIIHGRLNAITLKEALTDAFVASQDKKGQKILSQKIKMAEIALNYDLESRSQMMKLEKSFYWGAGGGFLEKSPLPVGDKKDSLMADVLARLCADSFKDKNYLLLLDDFEQNLENADKGEPGALIPEAADLLRVLLHYLPFSGKMTQMIITSRYDFSLSEYGRDLVKERMEKVWLTSFQDAELLKKVKGLVNILTYKDQSLVPRLLSAGRGNPRLMEWMDILIGQMKAIELPKLLEAIKDTHEDFVHQHVIRELLNLGGKELERFLWRFSIYRRPVLLEGVKQVVGKARLRAWQALLQKGMGLSLVEHDQVRRSYQVTPLLRGELLKNLQDAQSCHEAAFAYYKKVCENREILDPVLTEEWVYHALGCGEEDVASEEGCKLVNHLREHLAVQESHRVGEWIIAEKKQQFSTKNDAFFLNSFGFLINELGIHHKAIEYFEKALSINRLLYGEEHPEIALILSNLSGPLIAIGNYDKAIEYLNKSVSINQAIYGAEHIDVIRDLNNLYGIKLHLGEYKESVKNYLNLLAVYKKKYGENHVDICNILNNLAAAYFNMGSHREAVECLQQALSIECSVYGEEHPNVALHLSNMGAACANKAEFNTAIGYLEQSLSIFKKLYGMNNPNVATTLNNLGTAWQNLGNFQKAIDYFEQALSIFKKIYKAHHPNIALTLNNLGGAWNFLGEYTKAIVYLKQSLTIYKLFLGEEHPYIAKISNNIGESLRSLSQYRKAIDYFEQALFIFRKTYGDEHPDISKTLNNIGISWNALGEYHNAIDYLQQSLLIEKKFYGEEHPNIAIVFANLGESLRALGQSEKAIDYSMKALAIGEKIYGKNHPNIAAILNNIGSAWNELSEYYKAIDYFQQALSVCRSIYKENHPTLGLILNNLGESWRSLGYSEKAINYYNEALTISMSVYGENHPDVATSLNNIGLVWDNLNEPHKAIDYFEKSLKILKKIYGEKHPMIATLLGNLGSSYIDIAKTKKAIDSFEKALKIWEKLGEERNPAIANILNNLGLALHIRQDYHQAIEYYEKALSIYNAVYNEAHPDVANNLNNLGEAWFAIGEFENATACYESSLNILKKIHGDNHPQVAIVLNQLGISWRYLKESAIAIDYFEEALRIWGEFNENNNPNIATTLNNLGLELYDRDDYHRAIEYFEKAISIFRSAYGENDSDVATVFNNLGLSYFGTGQIDIARDHFEKAYEIFNELFGPKHPNTLAAYESLQELMEYISKE